MDKKFWYTGYVVRVIDGDSIVADIDMGLYMWKKDVNIRLAGINTPEVRGEERPKGLIAKAKVEEVLSPGQEIGILSIARPDKYGRLLAYIELEHNGCQIDNLSDFLIDNGYAKPYNGGTKEGFPLNEAYPLK